MTYFLHGQTPSICNESAFIDNEEGDNILANRRDQFKVNDPSQMNQLNRKRGEYGNQSAINKSGNKIVRVADTFRKVQFRTGYGFSKTSDVVLPDIGPFIGKVYVSVTLPPLIKTSGSYAAYTNAVGHALLKNVTLTIGRTQHIRQSGEWLEFYSALAMNDQAYEENCSNVMRYESMLLPQFLAKDGFFSQSRRVMIPLHFWFNNQLTKVWPAVSVPNQKLKLTLQWRSFQECVVYDGPTGPVFGEMEDAHLEVQYIQLPTNYLKLHYDPVSYRQDVPFQSIQSMEDTIKPFQINHTVKVPFQGLVSYLVVSVQQYESIQNNDYFNYTTRDTTKTAQIELLQSLRVSVDGKDWIDWKDNHILKAHSKDIGLYTGRLFLYVIPFCLSADRYSGSLNFSAVDLVSIHLNLTPVNDTCRVSVYGISHNIMHFEKGDALVVFDN